jgi:hypothetical protein
MRLIIFSLGEFGKIMPLEENFGEVVWTKTTA